MYIGNIFLIPTKVFSPEKGKTKATSYNWYSVLKTVDLIMVQLRIKAVCNVQRIKLGNGVLKLPRG